jgi:hypothetical protein
LRAQERARGCASTPSRFSTAVIAGARSVRLLRDCLALLLHAGARSVDLLRRGLALLLDGVAREAAPEAAVAPKGKVEEERGVDALHEEAGDVALARDVAAKGAAGGRGGGERLLLARDRLDGHADEHLRDLERRDEPRPARLLAAGRQSIVGVHERVDAAVHRGEDEAGGGVRREGSPALREDGEVVEPVEEDDGALREDEEERVDEFRDLGVDEGHRPEARGAEALHRLRGAADRRVEAVRRKVPEEVRRRAEEGDEGEDGEENVPRGEESLEDGAAHRRGAERAEERRRREDKGDVADAERDHHVHVLRGPARRVERVLLELRLEGLGPAERGEGERELAEGAAGERLAGRARDLGRGELRREDARKGHARAVARDGARVKGPAEGIKGARRHFGGSGQGCKRGGADERLLRLCALNE